MVEQINITVLEANERQNIILLALNSTFYPSRYHPTSLKNPTRPSQIQLSFSEIYKIISREHLYTCSTHIYLPTLTPAKRKRTWTPKPGSSNLASLGLMQRSIRLGSPRVLKFIRSR